MQNSKSVSFLFLPFSSFPHLIPFVSTSHHGLTTVKSILLFILHIYFSAERARDLSTLVTAYVSSRCFLHVHVPFIKPAFRHSQLSLTFHLFVQTLFAFLWFAFLFEPKCNDRHACLFSCISARQYSQGDIICNDLVTTISRFYLSSQNVILVVTVPVVLSCFSLSFICRSTNPLSYLFSTRSCSPSRSRCRAYSFTFPARTRKIYFTNCTGCKK